MRRSLKPLISAVAAVGTAVALAGLGATGASAANSGVAGDAVIQLDINDSAAGGTYQESFTKVYGGVAPSGTPVYIYVPTEYADQLGTSPSGIRSMDPLKDWNPVDTFTPCAEKSATDYVVTQDDINTLGDELASHILAIDEAHFGALQPADPGNAATKALVTIVYDLHDDGMYDCAETTYTAGYFAPEYIDEAKMNVMAVDAYDWANRIGDQTGNPDGRSQLYEGVIAHELEHLLHNYSDPGELSWVDEGLADFAVFLNGYNVGGSHLSNQQVFHRETSLTRWGGSLANYGAAYTYFQYLWEQAGGNGDGTFTPDGAYDGAGGDLLIKRIFQAGADGMDGVNAGINAYNTETGSDLRSAEALFKDWAVAVYLDDEGSDLYDIKAVNFGDPASTTWTVDIANDVFWDGRGQYKGALPDSKWNKLPTRPDPTALPFGVSYESFRNPGPTFSLSFQGDPTNRVVPHSEPDQWYGGYESQSDNILGVDTPITGGETLDFWTWYFIEEGWDYGFVEALVGTDWVTVPLVDDGGNTVTTSTNPHDNNEEGNGLTGTSGGEYFVDDPEYIHLSAELPAGATDVRFRYSTDAAYLDTGWFVDDVSIESAPAALSSPAGEWALNTGTQENDWSLQLIAGCDLTPGTDTNGEQVDTNGNHVYRLTANQSGVISAEGFSTKCASGTKRDVTAVISNLPDGDLDVLDADYTFRLVGGSAKK